MKFASLIAVALMMMSPAAPLLHSSPQKDVPAEVESAKRSLEGAKNDLEHAGGQWGGHRVAAIKHVDQALAELAEAEKWARAHHDMK